MNRDDVAFAFSVLGVAPDASQQEIEAAYRARLKLLHPDRVAGRSASEREAAAAMLADLQSAWSLVGDERSRARNTVNTAKDTGRASRSTPAHAPKERVARPVRPKTLGYTGVKSTHLLWRQLPDIPAPPAGMVWESAYYVAYGEASKPQQRIVGWALGQNELAWRAYERSLRRRMRGGYVPATGWLEKSGSVPVVRIERLQLADDDMGRDVSAELAHTTVEILPTSVQDALDAADGRTVAHAYLCDDGHEHALAVGIGRREAIAVSAQRPWRDGMVGRWDIAAWRARLKPQSWIEELMERLDGASAT